MTRIFVIKLAAIGSDNGLVPGLGQATIWTNTESLLIGPLRTDFSDILIEIHTFWFRKMHLCILKCRLPCWFGLNVYMTTVFYFFLLRSTVTFYLIVDNQCVDCIVDIRKTLTWHHSNTATFSLSIKYACHIICCTLASITDTSGPFY